MPHTTPLAQHRTSKRTLALSCNTPVSLQDCTALGPRPPAANPAEERISGHLCGHGNQTAGQTFSYAAKHGCELAPTRRKQIALSPHARARKQ
eukprot:8186822-Lingulodinium_polyedra.AAC.1